MATNNFDLTNGADIVFSDGTDTYGFKYASGGGMTENRVGQFAPSQGSSDTTYQDAEPFKRYVSRDLTGGFGQRKLNRQTGGTGQGGDPTKFMGGNAWTLNQGMIGPGLAVLGQNESTNGSGTSPTTANTSPLDNEHEYPKGILPMAHPQGLVAEVYVSNTNQLRGLEVLVWAGVGNSLMSYPQVIATITDLNDGSYLKVLTSTSASFGQLGGKFGYNWLQLNFERTGSAGSYVYTNPVPAFSLVVGHTYRIKFTVNAISSPVTFTNMDLVIGGYVKNNNMGTNSLQPYVRGMRASTQASFYRAANQFVQCLYFGSKNVGITTKGLVDLDDGNLTENVTSGGPSNHLGAIVFGDNLYVYTSSSAIYCYPTSSMSALSAGTATYSFFQGGAGNWCRPVQVDNYLYLYDRNNKKLYRWDGTNVAPTLLYTGELGNPSTLPQVNFFVINGMLYFIKPEGIYYIVTKPAAITTAEKPIIQKILSHPEPANPDTGNYNTMHNGVLCYNLGNYVNMVTFTNQTGTQVTPIAPNWTYGNLGQWSNVNGIISDSLNLYVSYNGVGVFAFNGKGWHTITETTEPPNTNYLFGSNYNPSGLGLGYNPNNTTLPFLMYGTGPVPTRVPLPSPLQPMYRSIVDYQQNRCFWYATSVWDGDLSEIIKFLKSVVLFAQSNSWQYKIVGSVWRAGDKNQTQIFTRTLFNGLVMDKFNSDTSGNSSTLPNVVSNSSTFSAVDFQNAYSMAEKALSANEVTNPNSVVSCSFIVYAWDNSRVYATTEPQIMEALTVKYIALLDYLAGYTCAIDPYGNMVDFATPDTGTLVNTEIAWLRGRCGAHGPTQAQFYGPDKQIKTINVFFTKNTFRSLSVMIPENTGQPGTNAINIQMLSTQEEYKLA